MRKTIIALAAALLLLTGCGTEPGQTRYVVLFSGGEPVAQVKVDREPERKYCGLTVTLPDGHRMIWQGDYLISDVPVEDLETVLNLMGG